MSIDITACEYNPDIPVVKLVCRLDALTEPELRPKVLEAVKGSERGIVLDLSGVDFVSSAGLRLLLVVHKSASADGKEIGVVGVQPTVYKIFTLAKFEVMFKIYKDEAEAVKALWA
ncbi:STAS domain-containing protein [Thermodesulfobacteriota bacterium]